MILDYGFATQNLSKMVRIQLVQNQRSLIIQSHSQSVFKEEAMKCEDADTAIVLSSWT